VSENHVTRFHQSRSTILAGHSTENNANSTYYVEYEIYKHRLCDNYVWYVCVLLCWYQQCPRLSSTSNTLIPAGLPRSISVSAVNLPAPRVHWVIFVHSQQATVSAYRSNRLMSLFVNFAVFCVTFCTSLTTYKRDFYRATLCVSGVFAVVRCLSVRLSVMFMYCIQTAEYIVKLLSQAPSF